VTDEARPGGDSASGEDPWAAPEDKVSFSKPSGAASPERERPSPFHDQATMAGGFAAPGSGPADSRPASPGGFGPAQAGPPPPGGPGSVPAPPVAPPDAASSGYGAPGGYGYPGGPGEYPGYPGYGWPGMPMPRQNGLGVAAMVLGILSVCLFCLYGVVSVVLGILAVVFGIKGRKRADRGEADNHGQAQAGFVLGIIGIVLGIAVIVLIAIGITAAFNDDGSYSDDPFVGNALGVSSPLVVRG
jgi:hypothetical protein